MADGQDWFSMAKPNGRVVKGKRGVGSGAKSECTSGSKAASTGGGYKTVKKH